MSRIQTVRENWTDITNRHNNKAASGLTGDCTFSESSAKMYRQNFSDVVLI